MLVGGILASSGMILASFTTNIIELYLTAGVLTGECLQNEKEKLYPIGLHLEAYFQN